MPDHATAGLRVNSNLSCNYLGNAVCGRVRLLHLIGSLIPFLPALYIYMVSADYRIQRLKSFWDPWQYHSDEGYQIVHSLMAFGTGGIWGTGIGQGFQKLFICLNRIRTSFFRL